MNIHETMLEIKTLGSFSISILGKPVAINWPSDTVKELFCSLLSPLDLYFTWDRISRSLLGVPATLTSRRHMDTIVIRPLNRYLIKELGFNPIIVGSENIRIDQQCIHVDARTFHRAVVEGLRLLSPDNHAAALEKFSLAEALYSGSYLPGMSGKIIENTRNDLETLYQTVVKKAIH